MAYREELESVDDNTIPNPDVRTDAPVTKERRVAIQKLNNTHALGPHGIQL